MATEKIRLRDHLEQSEEIRDEELHIEPIFSAFLCPLTKQVMRDPVTIENGHAYEREAIEDWFKECREKGRSLICPLTSVELPSSELKPSIALRNAIQEWTQRKEAAQLNLAYKSLFPGSSETDALNALNFIFRLCQKRTSKKLFTSNRKLLSSVANFLKSNSSTVRCRALQILGSAAESDEDKEAIADGDTILTIVKLLSHENNQERGLSVSLLYELSKSKYVSERIGGVYGTILTLLGLASSKSEDAWISDKAEKVLQNLEKSEGIVRQLAENGRVQPLLTLLLEGPPEKQLLMASYLEELVVANNVKVLMAQTASSSLLTIMSSGSMQAREVALKTMNKISSHEVSAKILVESGILPPLVKGLLDVGVNQLPVNLKEISAAILANVIVSVSDIESIQLGEAGLTLISEVVLRDLFHLIATAGSAIERKLLQVFVGLTRSPKTAKKIALFLKGSGATTRLAQFIEAPEFDTCLASIKILENVSPYIGQELTEAFLGAASHLSALIRVVYENNEVLEKQAAAIELLANLPEENSVLTKQLWKEGTYEIVVSKLIKIQQGEIRSNRYLTPFLEGLARVLSKLTYHLHDEIEYIAFARQHNLAALFSNLLQFNGLDEVSVASAKALENLSRESKTLTRVPDLQKPGCCSSIFACFTNPPPQIRTCRVHHGICSVRESFCLVEGGVVEKLIACLDNANVNVVDAALAALCTLLHDDIDIVQSVIVLLEADGVGEILDLLLEDGPEILKQHAVWAVERILRIEEMALQVSEDPSIVSALIDAFRHGNNMTRQIAEKALKHLNKLPNFPASV